MNAEHLRVDDAATEASRQQREAANPLASVFVTANAGSGKTKVLVDRIARLLLSGAPPSSFLCITYTKAAAAEMQRRLYARLGGWCVASDEKLAEDLSDLMGDADAARQNMSRARALFARALEAPGGLKIQTIHAFCERLLARFPLEARIAPGFEIADDATAKELVAQAWASVFANGGGAIADALARFSARLDQSALVDLFGRLVSERGALRRLSDMHGSLAKSAIAVRATFGPPTNEVEVFEFFMRDTPWAEVKHVIAALSGSSVSDQKAAAKLVQALEEHAIVPYMDFFLTQSGSPRANAITKVAVASQPFLGEFVRREGARVADCLARAKGAERGLDAEAAMLLGGALVSAYGQRKTERGVLDFDDLIASARALLEDQTVAPWVLYKLDSGIDHILIDEGQDTSPDQWSLLDPLQAEFFAGDGSRSSVRTVFAVGDPKQSIYSFQGADPARFLAERQALARRADAVGVAFRSPQLNTSFRSAPAVLAAVDATFEGLDALLPPPEGLDRVSHRAWRAEAAGAVSWWPICPTPQKASAEPWDAPLDLEADESAPSCLAVAIAETITRWIEVGETLCEADGSLRAMTAGDVLILVRQRGLLFRQLIKSCKRAGLAVAGADRLVLCDEIAVQDMLTLIRVALDPFDDLALACLMKGPWGAAPADDGPLIALAAGRGKQSLWSALQATDNPQFSEIRVFVHVLISRRGLSPFDFLITALEGLDEQGMSGWRRLLERLGAEARDPLQELVARAMAAPGAGRCDLQAFLASIEVDDAPLKREMDSEGQAVRIMTVHGAKGLEAPVVFLPDAAGPAKLGGDEKLLVDADGLAFSASEKDDDPRAGAMRAALKARLLGEHWRLLYVAMTRARDRLIVCGHARGNSAEAAKDSWHGRVGAALAPIGEPCETPFGPGITLGAPSPRLASGPPVAARQSALPDWLKRPVTLQGGGMARPSKRFDGAVLSPRAGMERFARGRLIHGLLQRLPEVLQEARFGQALVWLERQGVSGARAETLALEAISVIEDERFAAAFAPNSRAETAVVGSVGGVVVRGVIDRLAVSDREALIVDFKTDRPPPETVGATAPAYLLQLALYQAVVRQALPGRVVRCALVFTHAPRLIETPDALLAVALAGDG